MHCSAKRGIAIACRPSVRPSVRLSVTLVLEQISRNISEMRKDRGNVTIEDL